MSAEYRAFTDILMLALGKEDKKETFANISSFTYGSTQIPQHASTENITGYFLNSI